MLTRRFIFFCMMSVWGLMFSRLPIIQNIMPGGFLIVVLVSGWKYAFYYLAITTIPAIPSYWNTIVFLSQSGPYWTMVDQIRTGHLASAMQSIGVSLPTTSDFPIMPYEPFMALAIATGILIFLVGSCYITFLGLRQYIRLLRQVRKIAQSSNYRGYS